MEMLNPEKQDFLTLVGDVRGMESLSDEKIKEIHEHLLVRSFDEVLEKFEPAVYCYYNANSQKVMYSLEKPESIPEEMLTEIPLNRKNEFLSESALHIMRRSGRKSVDKQAFRPDFCLPPRCVPQKEEKIHVYGEKNVLI